MNSVRRGNLRTTRLAGPAIRMAGAGLGLALGVGMSLPAAASTWSDADIGYRYGTGYREPYNEQDITKNIISLTYASGYKYGSNFFNVDMLMSNAEDPASGGGGGAHEVYVVYRTTLSGGSVTGIPLKFGGVIRDIGLTGGFDFNAKDDQFSARVMKWAIGPKVSFEVPGFLDLAVVYRTESNHNWYATQYGCTGASNPNCGDVDFKDTAALEAAWGIPFTLGMPMKFQGFANYIGAKGVDGQGAATKPETLIEAAVMVDVGSLVKQKETFYVGGGYQYWHNKFGSDSSTDPTGGSTARVPQLELELHF
jgi:hypothetical protein